PSADPAIVEVHHAVRARLELGEPRQLDVDVPRARRAPRDDLDGQVVALEKRARLREGPERVERRLATRLPADDVGAVARVALEAAEPERALRRHRPGQGERGLTRSHTRPAVPDVHVTSTSTTTPSAVASRPRAATLSAWS